MSVGYVSQVRSPLSNRRQQAVPSLSLSTLASSHPSHSFTRRRSLAVFAMQFLALLSLAASAAAYQVTFPTASSNWTSVGPNKFTWDRECLSLKQNVFSFGLPRRQL
jgi:hypothetical protein